MISLLIALLISSLLVCALTPSATGVSLVNAVHVTTQTELRNAITNATTGVSVVIALDNDITLSSTPLTISANKNITLTSNSTNTFFKLIGASNQHTITVAAGGKLELAGITVTHTSNNGTGVYVQSGGTLNLSNGTISGNAARGGSSNSGYGGGIYNNGGNLTMSGGTITNNTATGLYGYGGGIYNNNGIFTLSSGTISNNTANTYGGGIHNNRGNLTITGGAVLGNIASSSIGSYGGGIYNNGNFSLFGGEISNNTANHGGGVAIGNGGRFTMVGGVISDNTVGNMGGGVYISNINSVVTMSGGTITNNKSNLYGGGVTNSDGAFTMSGGTITNNTATYGGGVSNINAGNFLLSGGTIANNTATQGGGVYRTGSGSFTISNGIISGNTATSGGGIYGTSFSMSNGEISGNTAQNGGGIYLSNGYVRLFGGVISSNTASDNGGGVWVAHANLYRLFVYNGVVFSNNHASTAYNRNPADDATYYAQIGPNVVWTTPFTQGYNNYDISYTNGQRIPVYTVTVDNSYAPTTGAGNYPAGARVTVNAGIRLGYTFANWTSNVGTITLPNTPTATFTMPATNIRLTANWQPTTYNLTYQLNGGSLPPNAPTTYSSATLPLPIPNAYGVYEFLGWTLTYANGTTTAVPQRDYRIPVGTYGNLILIANWDTNRYANYNITYQLNGGSLPANAPTTYNGTVLPLPIPNAYGVYEFEGWNVRYANGTTVTLQKNYTIPVGTYGNVTFTAQWSESPPASSFNVTKQTIPTDTTTTFNFTTNAPNGTFTLTDGQTWTSNNLPPGTYTITEHPQTGWNLINISVEGTTNYTTNLAAGTVSFTLEAGQNITLTYINLKHEPESGTITVDKRTVPSDSTVVFNFTTSTPAGTFSLTDRTSWSSGNLPPGTYIITELPTAGWNLTNIIVRGASNYTADVSTGTVTLHLASEENITITYQNAELPPQPNAFTVIKTTCPTGSTAIFNFVTSAPTGVFTLTDGQSWNSGNLPPGTYTITELTKAGWNLTNIIVEGTTNYTTNLTTGTITFTLEVGQHATILYQNTQLPPSTGTFTVIKSTCPMGSSAVFNFVTSAPTGTFTLTDGTSWNSGDLPPGAYTIAELAKAGWNLTNIIVDGATNYTINLAAGTVTFTLDAGHHVSIVYLNTELPPQPGTITVTKATCPTGASTPFSFVTSAPAGVFTLTDGQSWNSGNLPPGTYIITELAKAGWNLTNIIIDDPSGKSTIDLSTGTVTINLESGNHVTIIYQNTQLPPQPGTITVTKVTCPTGASTPFSFVTSAPAGTFTLIDGGVWNSGDLSSGKYIVTELNKAGWNLTNIIVVDPNDNSSVDLATGTVTINLEAGNHITIIYQNTEQTPEPDNCKKAPAVAVNAGDYPKPQ